VVIAMSQNHCEPVKPTSRAVTANIKHMPIARTNHMSNAGCLVKKFIYLLFLPEKI